MPKKISGTDKRLLLAVLVVCLVASAQTANSPYTACSDCELFTIKVTFQDNFSKVQAYNAILTSIILPNAVVIVTSTKKNQGTKLEKITLKSGETKTVTLEGQTVYAYTIFELEWAVDQIGIGDIIGGGIDPSKLNKFTTATRVLDTGIILDTSTISFQ